MQSGIPQGSVLGPALFTLFVNDLPATVTGHIKLFADDTKLYGRALSIKDYEALQSDLKAMEEWSETWQLPFNTAKCSVLHIGHSNPERPYSMTGTILRKVAEEKDLGLTVDGELKFHSQTASAVSRGNQILGVIKRTFVNLNRDTLPLLYKSLVRPHLEYANSIWGPIFQLDKIKLELVQRRATRLIPAIRHLTYEERLRYLKLPSLEFRRRRGDMVSVYNIMHGNTCLKREDFFQFDLTSTTRGHQLKVFKPRARTRPRRNHLSIRCINDWNSLPTWVVMSESTDKFKANLDEHWTNHMYDTPF